LLVQTDGRIQSVSFDQLENFHVCRTQELTLAAGDRLQLKGNGETVTGRKLANGELVTVKEIASDGRIRLTDGRILEKHYREFVRGYAVTSYASQGKTVDYVLFSDSADKAATLRLRAAERAFVFLPITACSFARILSDPVIVPWHWK